VQTAPSAPPRLITRPATSAQGCHVVTEVAGKPCRRLWHGHPGPLRLTCWRVPACGGLLRLIATLHDPAVIRKILAHLGFAHSRQSPGPAPPESSAAAP
jgi:hypothetical protein